MNIYVANLGSKVNDESLRELFKDFGDVSSAKVIVDKFSSQSRGFGFVEMSDDAAAKKAIAYCCDYQNADGSWYYSTLPFHQWIDNFHTGFDIVRIQVGHFFLCNFTNLFFRDAANKAFSGCTRAFGHFRGLTQEVARGRGFLNVGKGSVFEHGNDDRYRNALVFFRVGVKRLAEFHDVNALRTERGTDWRGRVGRSAGDRKVDITFYFLCHVFLQ